MDKLVQNYQTGYIIFVFVEIIYTITYQSINYTNLNLFYLELFFYYKSWFWSFNSQRTNPSVARKSKSQDGFNLRAQSWVSQLKVYRFRVVFLPIQALLDFWV